MRQARDPRLIFLAVFAVIAVGAVAAVLIGRSGGDGGDEKSGFTVAGCESVGKPAPKDVKLKPPRQTVRPGEKLTAVVDTSCGSFEIALDTKRAPKTTNSFAYLADKGFYDGLDFHRIANAPSFGVIQGGDPQGTGIGGPGYAVDEKPPANLAYTRGVVALAKSGVDPPGRSGSQFFIVTSADLGLPPDYALVGRVAAGDDVLARISKFGSPDEAGKPKAPVVIHKVTIEKG
jgi:cyclophilin family peptidyl-prolyl cis-trans isomerase